MDAASTAMSAIAMQNAQRGQLLTIAAMKQQAAQDTAIANMVADAAKASLPSGVGQRVDVAA